MANLRQLASGAHWSRYYVDGEHPQPALPVSEQHEHHLDRHSNACEAQASKQASGLERSELAPVAAALSHRMSVSMTGAKNGKTPNAPAQTYQ